MRVGVERGLVQEGFQLQLSHVRRAMRGVPEQPVARRVVGPDDWSLQTRERQACPRRPSGSLEIRLLVIVHLLLSSTTNLARSSPARAEVTNPSRDDYYLGVKRMKPPPLSDAEKGDPDQQTVTRLLQELRGNQRRSPTCFLSSTLSFMSSPRDSGSAGRETNAPEPPSNA